MRVIPFPVSLSVAIEEARVRLTPKDAFKAAGFLLVVLGCALSLMAALVGILVLGVWSLNAQVVDDPCNHTVCGDVGGGLQGLDGHFGAEDISSLVKQDGWEFPQHPTYGQVVSMGQYGYFQWDGKKWSPRKLRILGEPPKDTCPADQHLHPKEMSPYIPDTIIGKLPVPDGRCHYNKTDNVARRKRK